MLNLYIPYTSYNVLLSMAVAALYPDDDNFMLLVGWTHNLKETADVLSKVFFKNNMRYAALKKANIEDSNIRNFFLKKRNLKVLEEEIKQLPSVDRVFYIQEWNVYTTYAVHLAQRMNPQVSFNFLDDGIYTYVETDKKHKNCLERAADRLVYGAWHVNSSVPGALRKDCSVYALFPELLPGIYKNKRQARIDMRPLLEQINDGVLAEETHTCGEYGVDTIIATDFNASYASDEYRDIISSIISDCCDHDLKPVIKRHPADDGAVKFDPAGYSTKELLSYIPIELYYLRFRKSLKKIVGGLSTALLTARTMLPEAEIESIVSRKYIKCDENADKILELFSRVGVKITMIE